MDDEEGLEAGHRGPRRMPLLAPALALAAGIAVDHAIPLFPTRAWATLVLVAAAVGLRWSRGGLGFAALLLAFGAIGGACHHRQMSDSPPNDLARSFPEGSSRPAWVRGVLLTVPEWDPGASGPGVDEGFTRAELALTAIHDRGTWRSATARVRMTIAGDRTDLRAGEAVSAAGALGPIAGPVNPGERDARRAPRAHGIRLRLSVDDPRGINPDPSGRPRRLDRLLGRLRAWSQRELASRIDPEVAPLASALLLGRRGELDDEVVDAFGRTGTTHLLAISGMHFQALAIVLGAVGTVCGLRPRSSFLATAAVLLAYATLVGWTPSVSRSTIMALTLGFAWIAGGEVVPGNVLAWSALLTLLWCPADLFHPGWQLSFLAVGALIFVVEPVRHGLDRLRRKRTAAAVALDVLERRYEPEVKTAARDFGRAFFNLFLTSLVVTVVTVPATLWWFNVVAPIGILLNLVLIPLSTIALILCGLTLLLGWAWPLGTIFAWGCSWSLMGMRRLVEWGDAIPLGHLYLPSPPTWWVVASYALLAAWLWCLRRSVSTRIVVGGVLLGHAMLGAVLALSPARPASAVADVLAVGHGLSVVVQTTDGRAWLYDCGRLRDPKVGRRIIAPALWSRGVRRLEAVMISHADADHFDGLPDLLDRFSVGAVFVPPALLRTADPAARDLLAAIRRRGIPIRPLAAGDRLSIPGGLAARVLHPPRDWPAELADNGGSLVVELARGRDRLLLTGDIDGPGQLALTNQPAPGGFQVVLAPHHGGRTANRPEFYRWADPGVVVASQRQPRPGTVDALVGLKAGGLPVLRTWREGAIRLNWIGGGPRAEGLAAVGGGPPAPRGAPFWWSVVVVAGSFVAGLVGVIVLIVVEWGAAALAIPRRAPAGRAELPPAWQSVDAAARDGVQLRGWFREAQRPSGGTAVLLHGMGETAPAMAERAQLLLSRGWNVLLPDARAFGRSDGDAASFGARESGDVSTWIDRLPRSSSGTPIVVWGRSMGASIALRAATEDARIFGLILEAPYADLRGSVAAFLGRVPLPGARWLAGPLLWRAKRIAGASLDRPRPIDMAPLVQVPTLILHGGLDSIASPTEVARLAGAIEPSLVRVVEIADARHADVFEKGGSRAVIEIDALLARLPPSP